MLHFTNNERAEFYLCVNESISLSVSLSLSPSLFLSFFLSLLSDYES